MVTEKIPEILFSTDRLDILVEEGDAHRGSFFIESKNGIPMEGFIYSNNDKVWPEQGKIHGTKMEVSYCFQGEMATVGSAFEGDFIFITNGGEFNLPYKFSVIKKSIPSSIGKLESLQDFTTLYLQNAREAADLFFQPKFEDIMLAENPKEQALYHSLLKSRSRSLIVEEFLVSAGYKEEVRFYLDQAKLVMGPGQEEVSFTIVMEQRGCAEGLIFSQEEHLRVDLSRFDHSMFVDGKLQCTVHRPEGSRQGRDVIFVKTMRQLLAVPVCWQTLAAEVTSEVEQRRKIKRQQAMLMKNYIHFRTGSIAFEEFAKDSDKILGKLELLSDDVEWTLYRLHFAIMKDEKESAGQLLGELEERNEREPFSPICQKYLLYLKAMYDRKQEDIMEAVLSIRDYYQDSKAYKAEAFWLLIYLDRDYVYNKRLQYDVIRQLFEEGENSSLLYFEACEILNDNPGYLTELREFELRIICWGVRYGYISLSLAYQFAKLASQSKYYDPVIFRIAKKLYEASGEDRFLQVICSLLIKGNRMDKEYHEYFHDAVESNLKIIGLNEFFIRSMNFERYDQIPHRVLLYFTYSNSLDVSEKAYLYTNILKNREKYEDIFSFYYDKMFEFVEEQLCKGRINIHLAFLYQYFKEELLEKPENSKPFCDVIFQHRLKCYNQNMIGVYVYVPERDEEKYYPLSGGMTHVEVFNKRTMLFFVDAKEQRYYAGIEYELDTFLEIEEFPAEWIRRNWMNEKICLMLTSCIDGKLTKEDTYLLERVLQRFGYTDWIKKRATEQLLTYYVNHQEKEELTTLLQKTDYSSVTKSFHKRLMDYYMEADMVEHAFFGVELYGSLIIGTAKRLKLASFGVQHFREKMDDTVLFLCYTSFMRKKHNKDTLIYLMKYFHGEISDMLMIWERSKKFELKTTEFERRILSQAMFTKNHSYHVIPVLESCYEATPNSAVVEEYLSYISTQEIDGYGVLPDVVYKMIGDAIVDGRVVSRPIKTSLLYHFQEKTESRQEMKPAICHIIEEFLQEGYDLPVYHSYRNWVSLPVDYLEKTFLTYLGGIGDDVVVYYQLDDEKKTHQMPLECVLPGRYVCAMNFYQNDEVSYELEVNGVTMEDIDCVTFESFDYNIEESRFCALNRLYKDNCTEAEFEDYLWKAYIVDQYMYIL